MSSVLSVCERHNIVVFDMFVYSSLIMCMEYRLTLLCKIYIAVKNFGISKNCNVFLKKFRMLIKAIYLIKNTEKKLFREI